MISNYGKIIAACEIDQSLISKGSLKVFSPIDGMELARAASDSKFSCNNKINKASEAFLKWRQVPAPKRGELLRCFANELRLAKQELGKLVTIESGKILEEGIGEVQEMIDICDYASGLSRIIGGKTLNSEREKHTLEENWEPLGVIGVISAFNFPVAVWAWNFALAIVCGNAVIWKPSEKTPLCALACQVIFDKAVKKSKLNVPDGLMQVVIGDAKIGDLLVSNSNVKLLSATGSCNMGKIVAPKVAARLGRSLLELGGNNACIVTKNADLDVAIKSIIFGAVGTCGQRCTTLRRVFVEDTIYDEFFSRIKSAYEKVITRIGDPLEKGTLIGPLIDAAAFNKMQNVLDILKKSKDVSLYFGKALKGKQYRGGYYVEPALVKAKKQIEVIRQETFAPILYVMPYDNFDNAIIMHNDVPQGLSSAIFTNDIREIEYFKRYSDCGIVNVNIGTSGAEIGGAFGGEKETGGGRESGSDSWKAYMRRVTITTYYGKEAPQLAQGIEFEAS